MSEINNDDIKTILFDISKLIILPKHQNLKTEEIKLKNNSDLVTLVDIEVENYLKKKLLKILPNSLFVGEESFFKNPKIIKSYDENQFCWTVDPIDGTTNYVKGKDKFAIMIGLTFKEKIIQSWIYNPLKNEFCYSKLGDGSFINEKKLIIGNDKNLNQAVGSISSKYWEDDYAAKVKKINDKFKNISSYGCIGLEYVDIANQYRDFMILSRLSPWDHIPGILIVNEAGGSNMHFDKNQYNHLISKKNLIVANSKFLQNNINNLIRG